jgi:hypothetical protein
MSGRENEGVRGRRKRGGRMEKRGQGLLEWEKEKFRD